MTDEQVVGWFTLGLLAYVITVHVVIWHIIRRPKP
jgi:hypothetical protein